MAARLGNPISTQASTSISPPARRASGSALPRRLGYRQGPGGAPALARRSLPSPSPGGRPLGHSRGCAVGTRVAALSWPGARRCARAPFAGSCCRRPRPPCCPPCFGPAALRHHRMSRAQGILAHGRGLAADSGVVVASSCRPRWAWRTAALHVVRCRIIQAVWSHPGLIALRRGTDVGRSPSAPPRLRADPICGARCLRQAGSRRCSISCALRRVRPWPKRRAQRQGAHAGVRARHEM